MNSDTSIEETLVEPAAARKRSLLNKLLPAAAILLAAIFVLTTKQGTVVVEFPKDADGNERVPAGLKVVLQSDSETINITSKDDWEITASPDNYEIQITGANSDEFKFTPESATLTVSRFGNTLLKLTRQTNGTAQVQDNARDNTTTPNKTRPFWQLRREDIDPYELKVAGMGDPANAPKELVAVLGDSRLQEGVRVRFTPDSSQLISYCSYVIVRNVKTGREIRRLHGAIGGFKKSIALSADGHRIYADPGASYADAELYGWHLPSKEVVQHLDRNQIIDGSFLLFSHDNQHLISANSGGSGGVTWLDARTLKRPRASEPTGVPTRHFAISPDGKTSALGGDTGKVTIINNSDGRVLKTINNESRKVTQSSLIVRMESFWR
ncbi:MAG: hypothetical protein CMJ78_15960 [Planctomycetaceae bacterium]|nr:hypothetical protein [Planctomycetaceae bacterium]